MRLHNFYPALAKESKSFLKGAGKTTSSVAESISKNITDIAEVGNLRKLMGSAENYSFETVAGDLRRTKFGKISLADFTHQIKAGNIEEAFSRSIRKKLTSSEINILKADVVHRPTQAINVTEGELAKASRRPGGNKLKNVKNAQEFDKIVESDTKMKEWKNKNTNKTVGFLAKTTLAIGGAVTLGILVEQHMKKMSRCTRYVYDPESGLTTTCVINEFTCSAVDTSLKACAPETIKTEVGETIYNDKCTDSKGGCKHCNSAASDPIIEDINIAYRCKTATFLDAFTDMLGNAVEDTLGKASQTIGNASMTLLKHLIKPLLYLAGIVLLFVIIYAVYIKLKSKSNTNV